MTFEAISSVVLSVVLLVWACAIGWVWWSDRRIPVARAVVVNLKSGRGVSGLLVKMTGSHVVIQSGTVHEVGADPAPADGSLLIERGQVDFIQYV